MSAASPKADYDRLAKLVERELSLAREGRFDELAVAIRQTGAMIATFGSNPPASARAALNRARAVRERVEIEVLAQRRQIEHSRIALRTARRVKKTYSRPPGRRYSITA